MTSRNTILKGAAGLVAVVILFLVVVANFGTSEHRLLCDGELRAASGPMPPTPAMLYLRVDAYRWFLFWFDYDAMISWELQPGGSVGFGYYDESPFATRITDLAGTRTYGSFSSLSGHINVEAGFDGTTVFDGDCK